MCPIVNMIQGEHRRPPVFSSIDVFPCIFEFFSNIFFQLICIEDDLERFYVSCRYYSR